MDNAVPSTARRGGPSAAARGLGTVAVVLALTLTAPGVAQAVGPPQVDPHALVLGAPVAPPEPTQQRLVCAHPVWTGPAQSGEPAAQRELALTQAWQFSRGAGQLVAVIDTGVNRHPRLSVVSGGDYVSNSDGTADCDGHGTLVSGIIAAHPAPDGSDRFSGVAPEAAILSIRQTSLAYSAANSADDKRPGQMSTGGFGTVNTLAYAIVHAIDMHATVINISEVSCTAAGQNPSDGALGAALKYAADRDVVVVAAAGNLESQGACKTQNGAGWDGVKTIASPAWFAPNVLSVGSVEPDGAPSTFTLHGPWVGVAAPGSNLMSLDSSPGGTGLVNGIPEAEGKTAAINGTSFSSAFVSGVAALVRARYPGLPAAQVIERIVRTAHAPGDGRDDSIGAGLVDPVAALTADLPARSYAPDRAGRAIAAPRPEPRVNPWPRRIGIGGALTCLILLAIVQAVSIPLRSRHHMPLDLPGGD
ncbi:MAG: type VII secretion-associated serine protease mycosin [Mycobacterium sp.]|nr:type VII secretion-associated serine protease mycosin [Mycobacterium sp.]